MLKKSRRNFKHQGKAEINVVPFLDVLLVLLLIFMISAPVINKSLEVKLPASSTKSPVENNDKVVVLEVVSAGVYNLLIDKTRYSNLTTERLDTEIKILLSQQTTQKYLFQIAGNANINYQALIDGMDILKKAGVADIGLITRPLNNN